MRHHYQDWVAHEQTPPPDPPKPQEPPRLRFIRRGHLGGDYEVVRDRIRHEFAVWGARRA